MGQSEYKEMIPEIIDEIPADAIMYLINALAFEGEWQVKYEEEDIEQEYFYRVKTHTKKSRWWNRKKVII